MGRFIRFCSVAIILCSAVAQPATALAMDQTGVSQSDFLMASDQPDVVAQQAIDEPEQRDGEIKEADEAQSLDDQSSQQATDEPVAVSTPNPEQQVSVEETPAVDQSAPADDIDPPVVRTLAPVITEVSVNGTCKKSDGTACESVKGACTTDAEFVELFNPYDESLSLQGLRLQYSRANSATAKTAVIPLNNVTMAAGSMLIIGCNVETATVNLPVDLVAAGGALYIDDEAGTVYDQVAWGNALHHFYVSPAVEPKRDVSLQRCFVSGLLFTTDPRNTKQEFSVYTNELPTPGSGLQCPGMGSVDPAPPLNDCTGLALSEVAAYYDDQFIELHNTTDHPIDVTGCRLQTNRSSAQYELPSGSLEANSYMVVYIRDTQPLLTLTKTTTGSVYLLASDGETETDSVDYQNLTSGTTWARFDDGWRQTYVATPGATNIYQAYVSCDDGYVRNLTTGRCNKIVTPTEPVDCGDGKYRSEETGRCRAIPQESVLAACKLGQYRSEETNRCRNIVTAAALTPCRDNQYRSEETNRCRNIASTASTLKPCNDNQYRSEETNRCRTIQASAPPAAAYAVEPIKQGALSFVGWWALGGVLVGVFVYAAWEWRSEIRRGLQRLTSVRRQR